MAEVRDPKIKLFGRTIAVPEKASPPAETAVESDPAAFVETDDTKGAGGEPVHENVEGMAPGVTEELADPESSSILKGEKKDNLSEPLEKRKAMAMDQATTTAPKSEEEQVGTDGGAQDKALKKPTQILPCPRCNSSDTKFCYYNNYNVNQPRHYCKNCQRYWTAGGTMRNVPVGAGRRKSKHSASNYRHIMMSDAMPTRVENPDSSHHQVLSCGIPVAAHPLQGNETVLKFGPDAPLSESMGTVLNLGDQKINAGVCEVVEESSCGSLGVTSKTTENELPENATRMEQGGVPPTCCNGISSKHHLPCYAGPPWSYSWNPTWNNIAAMPVNQLSSKHISGFEYGNPNQPGQWNSPPMLAAPAFCTPSIPFPLVPASYWGCNPGWAPPGAWSLPWLASNGVPSPTSSTSNSGCSGNGSPILGKHPRDTNFKCQENAEKYLWVPKTLRIDDPDEAKSSIWATLGIKHDKKEIATKAGTGIFKAFQTKTQDKTQSPDAGQVLLANPAALSRSQTFQEST